MNIPALSRREREIMDILFAASPLSAAEVRARMSDAPGDSAVRTLLRILEEKGHVTHEEQGLRYVYAPTVSLAKAQRSAVRALVDTFFGGSREEAVAALIDEKKLSDDELDRLAQLIE